jgi:hypothetical protein
MTYLRAGRLAKTILDVGPLSSVEASAACSMARTMARGMGTNGAGPSSLFSGSTPFRHAWRLRSSLGRPPFNRPCAVSGPARMDAGLSVLQTAGLHLDNGHATRRALALVRLRTLGRDHEGIVTMEPERKHGSRLAPPVWPRCWAIPTGSTIRGLLSSARHACRHAPSRNAGGRLSPNLAVRYIPAARVLLG